MTGFGDAGPAADGMAQLAPMLGTDWPGIGAVLGFRLIELEAGRVVFEGAPGGSATNPLGTVHGGWIATLLDTACGSAVQSRLAAGLAFTTLELKLSFLRAVSPDGRLVRAEGSALRVGRRAGFAEARLIDAQGRDCARASSTILIFPQG